MQWIRGTNNYIQALLFIARFFMPDISISRNIIELKFKSNWFPNSDSDQV